VFAFHNTRLINLIRIASSDYSILFLSSPCSTICTLHPSPADDDQLRRSIMKLVSLCCFPHSSEFSTKNVQNGYRIEKFTFSSSLCTRNKFVTQQCNGKAYWNWVRVRLKSVSCSALLIFRRLVSRRWNCKFVFLEKRVASRGGLPVAFRFFACGIGQ